MNFINCDLRKRSILLSKHFSSHINRWSIEWCLTLKLSWNFNWLFIYSIEWTHNLFFNITFLCRRVRSGFKIIDPNLIQIPLENLNPLVATFLNSFESNIPIYVNLHFFNNKQRKSLKRSFNIHQSWHWVRKTRHWNTISQSIYFCWVNPILNSTSQI